MSKTIFRKFEKNGWPWLIHIQKRFRFVFLALYLLSVSLAVFFSSKLTVEADLARLLPTDTEIVKEYDALREQFGGFGYFIVTLEMENSQPDKLRELAYTLEKRIKSHEFTGKHTKRISYRIPADFIEKYGMFYAEEKDLITLRDRLQKKIQYELRKANPYLLDIEETAPVQFFLGDLSRKYKTRYENSDIFLDKDGKRIAILIKPDIPYTNLAFARNFQNSLREILSSMPLIQDMKWRIGGRYAEELTRQNLLSRDINRSSFLTLLLLSLLIVIFFRSFRSLFVVGIPMVAALAYTYAFAWYCIGRMNIISAFLVSILLGMGIDYGIHLFAKYKIDRVQGMGVSKALENTLRSLFSGLVSGAFTTSIVFYSISFSRFAAFSEFGLIAAMGVLFFLVSFMVYFPVLIFFTERFSFDPTPNVSIPVKKSRYRLFQLALIMIIVLVGVSNFYRIPFEYDFFKLEAESEQIDRVKLKIEGFIESRSSPIIYRVNSEEKLHQLEKYFSELKHPWVGDRHSILDITPKNPGRKRLLIADINKLFKQAYILGSLKLSELEIGKLRRGINATTYLNFSSETFPDDIKSQFYYKPEKGEITYFYYLFPGNLENAPHGVFNFIDTFREICLLRNADNSCGELLTGISDTMILQTVLDIVITDLRRGLLVISLLILVLVFLLTRSASGFILAVMPLMLSVFFLLGIMYVASHFSNSLFFRFNYVSLLSVPVIMGIGIDNGIFLVQHLQKEGVSFVHNVMRETGSSVFMATMTTGIGFSSLAFASHNGLATFGVLASAGMVCTYFSYSIFFPVIARWLERRGLLSGGFLIK